MLKDSLQRIYAKVFFLQCAIALGLVLLLLPFDVNLSLSALAGATAVLLGNGCYILFETRGAVVGIGQKKPVKKRLGGRIFGRHLLAELLKIAVIAALLLLALASGLFSALWVVIAASIVIVGHGFAFLIIR
jgi:hypothetical protein